MTVRLPSNATLLATFFYIYIFLSIASETPITAWQDHKGFNQAWFIRPITPGSDVYTIQSVTGGSYVDLTGGNAFPNVHSIVLR